MRGSLRLFADLAQRVKSLEQLPQLPRPLGVHTTPSIHANTTSFETLVKDDKTRLAQRQFLEKELLTKPYFGDLNDTRFLEGKTWLAPQVNIREDKALYFPNISGKSLDKGTTKHTTTLCFGKISVISMLSTRISEIHCQTYTKDTRAAYDNHPYFQHIQINVQENVLKSILVKIFSSSLRSSVPPQDHPLYLISSQNLDFVRDPMGLVNSRIGYVYLVDENCKIRWAAGSNAMRNEAADLQTCTGLLLKRLEKSAHPGKPKDVVLP
ncbi:ATPase assembly factor ATP10 [Flagelloscypha sp. PMI_526]|nr:ATPase assembly factor ATP10 [Flagelloscypha sp. PMI_526]